MIQQNNNINMFIFLLSKLKFIKNFSKIILTNEIENYERKIEYFQNLIKYNSKFVPCHDDSIVSEYEDLQFSYAAISKLLRDYEFNSVLDIGAGSLQHSMIFAKNGKKVTAIDLGKSKYFTNKTFNNKDQNIKIIVSKFEDVELTEQFDCVWISHVLEHQKNVGLFLTKVKKLTKENGIIAITVPPLRHNIVGGHLTIWNAGLILYNLVVNGIDCSNAKILSYGYNISVIVNNHTFKVKPDLLTFDYGDIKKLKCFFPTDIKFYISNGQEVFNGNIKKLNW